MPLLILLSMAGKRLRVWQVLEHAGDDEGGAEADSRRVLRTIRESGCEGVLRVLWDIGVDVGGS